MLIDTHCHLDFPEFDPDRDKVIADAKGQGIDYFVNIGSSLRGSAASLELAAQYGFIYAAVGIHPHEADSFNDDAKAKIKGLAARDKVVAIGEIGLDYYLPACRQGKNFSRKENQLPLFIFMTGLAKELNLPLVIHSRQAQEDTIRVLKEAMPVRAVVHCFCGDEDFLKDCLDLGFSVSYTCNITYLKAQGLRELVRLTPIDRMFLETDAPFLPPQGRRGRRNEPVHVKDLAAQIARIKGLDFDQVARVTSSNALDFFSIKV